MTDTPKPPPPRVLQATLTVAQLMAVTARVRDAQPLTFDHPWITRW